MVISDFSVRNYKSFHDTVRFKFSRGLNFVVGRNNAGKTALLEALSFRFRAIAHRSPATVAREGAPIEDSESHIEVAFDASENEVGALASCFRRVTHSSSFLIPKPTLGSEFARRIGYDDDSCTQELLDWFLRDLGGKQQFEYHAPENYAEGSGRWVEVISPDHVDLQAGDRVACHSYEFKSGTFQHLGTGYCGRESTARTWVAPTLAGQIYRFRAERPNRSFCEFGDAVELAADASNLPEVLNRLQNSRASFQRLNEEVSRIFTGIRCVSVRPNSKQLEIMVWPDWAGDPRGENSDLAVSLAHSGTGVGQVLGILYVVLTSRDPKTILIDEPQSFLHPSAARKLMDTLQEHSRHQYIIATHSPAILSTGGEKSIHLIQWNQNGSEACRLDPGDVEAHRSCLLEVGVRLSDVFGADSILWVEGATEEECFPLILQSLTNRPPAGMIIRGVVSPSDLLDRDRGPRLVLEIYRKMSGSGHLVPATVGFVFDSELRSDSKRRDLTKEAGGRMFFTERRMYENYLLHPGAVAHVLKGEKVECDPQNVKDLLNHLIEKSANEVRDKADGSKSAVAIADGARVLDEVFKKLSDGRVEFRKTSHAKELTRWIVANDRATLDEIVQLLNQVLKLNSN